MCASDDHNNMRHLCAKELLDSNFDYVVIYKILTFKEIAPYFKNLQISFKYTWNFLDQPFLPYKFHRSDM